MKKKIIALFTLCLLFVTMFNGVYASGTELFSEDFINPSGVEFNIFYPNEYSGSEKPDWNYVNASQMPGFAAPYSDSYCASFNSGTTNKGNLSWLESSDIIAVSNKPITFEYYIYNHKEGASFNDCIRPYFYIDQTEKYCNPVYRCGTASFSGWVRHEVTYYDVYQGMQFNVGLLGISGGGYDIYIDSIRVTQGGDVLDANTVVYDQSPYAGEYAVIYNESDDISHQSTATMSEMKQAPLSFEAAAKTDLPDYTKAIVEIEGKTLYELDPQSFLRSTPNPDIPLRTGQEPLALGQKLYSVGRAYEFTSYDFYLEQSYTFNANHLYDGTYCDVFVEGANTGKITAADAFAIGKEFDEEIQDFMVQNFGSYISYVSYDGGGNESGLWLEGKIAILIENIRDPLYHGSSDSFIGGYFDPDDIFNPGSNKLSMVHIDIDPLMKSGTGYDIENAYSTLVHEFQHLINFTDYILDLYSGNSSAVQNQLWLDEAFSMAAEHMMGYSEAGNSSVAKMRINDFNNDDGNIISNGAILNYTDYEDNDDSIAANYGMAFLFGQYIRTQTKNYPGGGNSIYRRVLESEYSDYRAVMEGLSDVGYQIGDFGDLNRNFRIAMTQKDVSGVYGFAGESIFNSIKMPLNSSSSVTLNGGAAVVKKISAPLEPSSIESGIKIAGFEKEKPTIMAHYFTDTSNNAVTEIGTLDSIRVNFTVGNSGGKSPEIHVYIASYNTAGKLVGFKTENISPESGESTSDLVDIDIDVPADQEIGKIKSFIWSDTMYPYNKIEIM